MDSVSNFKHASGSVLKQLIDAVKHAIENSDEENENDTTIDTSEDSLKF